MHDTYSSAVKVLRLAKKALKSTLYVWCELLGSNATHGVGRIFKQGHTLCVTQHTVKRGNKKGLECRELAASAQALNLGVQTTKEISTSSIILHSMCWFTKLMVNTHAPRPLPPTSVDVRWMLQNES
jgi:hypothetical protein